MREIKLAFWVSTPGQRSLKFKVLLQEGEHLLEISCQMNKIMDFKKIIVFGQHCIGQWHIQCWFISCMLFIIFHGEKKSLLQQKEYNWAISYQIKKEICFNIYNQLIWKTLHRLVIYSMFVNNYAFCILHIWLTLQWGKWKKIFHQEWTRSWFMKYMMQKLLNVDK